LDNLPTLYWSTTKFKNFW